MDDSERGNNGQNESRDSENDPCDSIDTLELWSKYEDIAMHFNNLLIQLRMRSLAVIAAVATVVGVIVESETLFASFSWFMATMLLAATGIVWFAVGCLDLLYYNRLLRGAVLAIKKLEKSTKEISTIRTINFSRQIEKVFEPGKRKYNASVGVLIFYLTIEALLFGGATYALVQTNTEEVPIESESECIDATQGTECSPDEG